MINIGILLVHSSLEKLGVVWLNVKTYQTDCPVKNINFRVDCALATNTT